MPDVNTDRTMKALTDYAISRKGIKLMHLCTYKKENRNHADCTQLQFDDNYCLVLCVNIRF